MRNRHLRAIRTAQKDAPSGITITVFTREETYAELGWRPLGLLGEMTLIPRIVTVASAAPAIPGWRAWYLTQNGRLAMILLTDDGHAVVTVETAVPKSRQGD